MPGTFSLLSFECITSEPAHEKNNQITNMVNRTLSQSHLLSIRSTFRGVLVRYCLFWMYDGDMAGDDDDESDLRCLLLRTGSDVVTKVDDDDDVGMAVDDNSEVLDDMSDAVVVVVMAFVMAA